MNSPATLASRLAAPGRVLFPALGAIFCLVNGLGGKIACFTLGCSLYADYGLLGLSFYWWGLLAFSLALGSLALERRFPAVYYWLTLGLLAGDALFLAWLVVFLPCSSCLLVALLIALGFLSGLVTGIHRGVLGRKARRLAFGLLGVWTPLFLLGVGDTARELVRPWPIHGDASTSHYEIWFSLTCPRCQETLRTILMTPGMTDRVVLYPVAKDEDDLDKFNELLCGLQHEVSLWNALEHSWGLRECSWPTRDLSRLDRWLLRLRLNWNKALLVRKGYSTVPILVANKLLIVEDGCKPVSPEQKAPEDPDAGFFQEKPGCQPGQQEPSVGCSIN